MIENPWDKNAVIYNLDVGTFIDANGDGHGDFEGLMHRLDYLARLGVTCLWLLPFQPSPDRDNGYDIMDYYGVDPRHGSLGDFVEFMHQARGRGRHHITLEAFGYHWFRVGSLQYILNREKM
jgi:maltose alpha-D-glucosyltransferase / alpha-amylase